MPNDPYADLQAQFHARRRDYILSLAAQDPEQRPARARGYLRGVPGNRVNTNGEERRPTATADEIRTASERAGNNQAFWPDSNALRTAGMGEDPLDADGISDVVARLAAANLSKQAAFPPWFVKGLVFPAPDQALHLRRLLAFTYRLGACVWAADDKGKFAFRSIQDWIGFTLKPAPEVFVDAAVADRIRASLDLPDPQGLPDVPSPALVERLSSITLEGEAQPLSAERVSAMLGPIAALLHAPRLEPDEKRNQIASEGDPRLYGDFETALDAYLNRLMAASAPLSPSVGLPRSVWDVLELLSFLGSLSGVSRGTSLVRLAVRLPRAPHVTTDATLFQQVGQNPYLLVVLLFRPNVELPGGWQWPDQTPEGLYWWRAILHSAVIGHILSYKDTADFHVADLLRLAGLCGLFEGQRDPRVPEYIATDIRVALEQFKYWFDGPPQYDRAAQIEEGHANREMTFWSENHTVLFASAQVLVGQYLPNASFPHSARSGEILTGQQLNERGKKLLTRWLDDRLRFGFSEWNAAGYYNEDFPPLFNVVDFCSDAGLATKAAMVVDLLIHDLARFNSRGSFGTSAGRVYFPSKSYGWQQSIGDTMQMLFGTRGDYLRSENSAIALATSKYEVPHALLAIGLDRVHDDRNAPFVDRSRLSINRDEASRYGIGFEDETDVAYWWSTGSYFTDETLAGTRKVVEAHDNLRTTNPFAVLDPDPDLPWYGAIASLIIKLSKVPIVGDVVEAGVGTGLSVVGQAGLYMPFPINLVALVATTTGALMAVAGAINAVVDLIKSGRRLIEKLFGSDDEDDSPVVPPSTIVRFLEELVKTFNAGSTLSRVNLYHYCNGDALLGSAQNHLKGKLAFQKSAWQATIDCEANVWTGSPPSNIRSFTDELGTEFRAWLEFFKSIFQLRPLSAIMDLALPFVDPFGDDGPNYWTGEFALPMVVQHECAAIIAYNIPNARQAMHAAATHAWFPKAMFDDTYLVDKDDGTWVFGRKRDGFVALYSARRVRWEREFPHGTQDPFKDRELYAEGGSNIWVCMIGNTQTFKPPNSVGPQDEEALRRAAFTNFKNEVCAAYLSVSGVGTMNQLECSFDVPRAKAPPGRSPRLELFYDDDEGRFAGDTIELDDFPRFENKYCRVPWGARRYDIRHRSGLTLSHDLDAPKRTASRQKTTPTTETTTLGVALPARQSARSHLISAKRNILKKAVENG